MAFKVAIIQNAGHFRNHEATRFWQKSWKLQRLALQCLLAHHRANITIFLLTSSAFRWPRGSSGLTSNATCQCCPSVLPGPRILGRVPKFTPSYSGKGFCTFALKNLPASSIALYVLSCDTTRRSSSDLFGQGFEHYPSLSRFRNMKSS